MLEGTSPPIYLSPHPSGGPELGPQWRGGGGWWQQRWLLWREQPVREPGAHDPHLFLQGLLLRQAGGGEGGGEARGVELRAGGRPATSHFGGADLSGPEAMTAQAPGGRGLRGGGGVSQPLGGLMRQLRVDNGVLKSHVGVALRFQR